MLAMKIVRGQRVSVNVETRVTSRPAKSPVFQRRKASGMKHADCSIRGSGVSSSSGRTLVICCVKTGKTIVMAKVRKTALDR